jgi:hypothetical protein
MQGHRGGFLAIGTDGKEYTVWVLVRVVQRRSFSDPNAVEMRRLPKFVTSAGQLVSPVRKGEYRILATGVSLRSDDPDAP